VVKNIKLAQEFIVSKLPKFKHGIPFKRFFIGASSLVKRKYRKPTVNNIHTLLSFNRPQSERKKKKINHSIL